MSKHTKVAREARHREIVKLYLQGMGQYDIASKLEVSQGTVSLEINKARKRWVEEVNTDVAEITARELAKIDVLELTYNNAWLKSCEDFEEKESKRKGKLNSDGQTVKGDSVETRVKQVRMMGNPRYLDGVLNCIKARREMLGLDAPVKSEVTHRGGVELRGADNKIWQSNEESVEDNTNI